MTRQAFIATAMEYGLLLKMDSTFVEPATLHQLSSNEDKSKSKKKDKEKDVVAAGGAAEAETAKGAAEEAAEEAAAHRMSVYSVSAFLAETLFLVKTPPKAPRFGSGLPSHRVGHLRRSRGNLAARAPQTSVSGQPRGNTPIFVNIGRQPALFGQGGLK